MIQWLKSEFTDWRGGMVARHRMGVAAGWLLHCLMLKYVFWGNNSHTVDEMITLHKLPWLGHAPLNSRSNLSLKYRSVPCNFFLLVSLFLILRQGARWPKWLEREFTDRKVRGSNPTSSSRLPLSRLGQPGSIPALVLPSGGMAARHRKGATAGRQCCCKTGWARTLTSFWRMSRLS
ncbi:hypothetical protein CSKR_111803 [Clonorchis sinensis]|uniref:Uncharacterized protein n=1 Tax=Clonorchis sinensis TaxID=79923 RepID=A0A419PZ90_CLOSI|nr:hypothetical protein CSKR_111803 [Clonorchis sinensis]